MGTVQEEEGAHSAVAVVVAAVAGLGIEGERADRHHKEREDRLVVVAVHKRTVGSMAALVARAAGTCSTDHGEWMVGVGVHERK